MIAEKMQNMVKNSSAIRAMFEEGNRLAQIYGRENVYDFSLGNPNVPAPKAVKEAIMEILESEDPVVLHGYTNSNAGYPEVREAVASSLNERFGTAFAGKNIVMTVGAAGGLNVALKILLNPGDEVIVFAPYFGEYRSYTANFDGVKILHCADCDYVLSTEKIARSEGNIVFSLESNENTFFTTVLDLNSNRKNLLNFWKNKLLARRKSSGYYERGKTHSKR